MGCATPTIELVPPSGTWLDKSIFSFGETVEIENWWYYH